MLLGTGMRMAEALELDWQDVDLVGARAILRADQTKGKKRRNVTLPPRLITTLANLQHREGAVIRRPDGIPYADRRRRVAARLRQPRKRHCVVLDSIRH